jgi:hypothetical protein
METPITLTLHGLTFGCVFAILGILLHQHKIWIRVKDRLDSLWAKRCEETGERFVPLDNGK